MPGSSLLNHESSRARNLGRSRAGGRWRLAVRAGAAPATTRQGSARGSASAPRDAWPPPPRPLWRERRRSERRQDPRWAGRRRLGRARCYITQCTSLGLGPLAPFAAPAPSTASLPPTLTPTLQQCTAPALTDADVLLRRPVQRYATDCSAGRPTTMLAAGSGDISDKGIRGRKQDLRI